MFLRSEANQAIGSGAEPPPELHLDKDVLLSKDVNPRLFMEYFLTFSKQICAESEQLWSNVQPTSL